MPLDESFVSNGEMLVYTVTDTALPIKVGVQSYSYKSLQDHKSA